MTAPWIYTRPLLTPGAWTTSQPPHSIRKYLLLILTSSTVSRTKTAMCKHRLIFFNCGHYFHELMQQCQRHHTALLEAGWPGWVGSIRVPIIDPMDRDEVAVGYRRHPCGHCLHFRYGKWSRGLTYFFSSYVAARSACLGASPVGRGKVLIVVPE